MARVDYDSFPIGPPMGHATLAIPSYRMMGGIELPPATPPQVVNVSPAPGTAIPGTTPLVFEVTDLEGLLAVLIGASFANVPGWELVFDGAAFAPNYRAGSTVTVIQGGLRFQLMRDGGWPGAPTITPYPFDTTGLEG